MKLPTLLLLISAAGLFAAEEAKPTTTSPAAPAATSPAAPAVVRKSTKVPGVSDDDYQKHSVIRRDIEKNDPAIKALKATADAAKEKANSAAPADKEAAEKEAKDADNAFTKARDEVLVKRAPELADVTKKVSEFWVNHAIAKKKKMAAEAAAAAAAAEKTAAPATK